MKTVIYLDVLLLINLLVNYFLLLSVEHFTAFHVRRLRLLAGAAVGSLSSFLILLPALPDFLLFIIKLLLSGLITAVAFGIPSAKGYLKAVFAFWGFSFLFGGAMLALYFFCVPQGMVFRNGTVYFSISAWTLAVATILTYLVISAVRYLAGRGIHQQELRKIWITADGKTAEISGLYDTGNHLEDIFTGMPVIICSFDSIKSLLPMELYPFFLSGSLSANGGITGHRWASRIRVVPYHSVGNQGLLAAFRPDDVMIEEHGRKVKRKVLIGVTPEKLSDGAYSAILGRSAA